MWLLLLFLAFCSGCLAQYVGVLDSPWTNVADALEKLWHHSIKTEYGIEEIIKSISVKLSEAIMHAMENGQELEKKVSQTEASQSYFFIFLFLCDNVYDDIVNVRHWWWRSIRIKTTCSSLLHSNEVSVSLVSGCYVRMNDIEIIRFLFASRKVIINSMILTFAQW